MSASPDETGVSQSAECTRRVAAVRRSGGSVVGADSTIESHIEGGSWRESLQDDRSGVTAVHSAPCTVFALSLAPHSLLAVVFAFVLIALAFAYVLPRWLFA